MLSIHNSFVSSALLTNDNFLQGKGTITYLRDEKSRITAIKILGPRHGTYVRG